MPAQQAATIGGIVVAIIYACLAGFSVPTQRTLYMLLTFSVALLLNKKLPISRVLAIALIVVVLLDPWSVVSSGFWLSFSAIAIIAYVSVGRLVIANWFHESVITQWAVTIGLLPLLILIFGQASLISPIANAFAIPIISLGVVPLAILGVLLPTDFILHASYWMMENCMQGLNWLAKIPMATWSQAVAPAWSIVLAIIGVLWMLLPRGFPQRWLGLILLLPMLIAHPQKPAQGEMKVDVLDVGQGLAVVVQTATHVFLYDAGPSYSAQNDAGSKIIVPFLRGEGIKKLDGMMISHNDMDHSGGMVSILAQLPVSWLSSSFELPENDALLVKRSHCVAGQKWVWDKVSFEVLYPSLESYELIDIKDNNRSCVVKVTSRYGSILLTGDIEKEAEAALLKANKDGLLGGVLLSDVLIAPHHGSKTSSTLEFVKAVGAKHTIFTVGYLNRFKHPKPLIEKRYEDNGALLYRSDYQGEFMINFTKTSSINIFPWRGAQPKYWHDKY